MAELLWPKQPQPGGFLGLGSYFSRFYGRIGIQRTADARLRRVRIHGISRKRYFDAVQETSICLKSLNTPVSNLLLRKGHRTFGLLGKVGACGLTAYGRDDIEKGWALTAEFGCLRIERLFGDESLTGDKLVLPTSGSYNFGITGPNESAETVRIVFGVSSSELELLVNTLRRGSFPLLGFSRGEQLCSISGAVIPPCWPHLVLSNMTLCGNVVSMETFMRITAASLPQNPLGTRFPVLQPVLRQVVKIVTASRHGIPYTSELFEIPSRRELVTK